MAKYNRNRRRGKGQVRRLDGQGRESTKRLSYRKWLRNVGDPSQEKGGAK